MNFLRTLFFTFIIRPFILIILGLNVRRMELLPKDGPAIIVANHNSHLDTVVLMTLFKGKLLHKIRPVAAADYFLKNKLIAFFSLNMMNIIPLNRRPKKRDQLFDGIYEALDQKDIIILFPEGSRGEPEQLAKFKSGIYHLLKRRPEVPVYPVYMHGLGKSLPKGDPLFVPFFCDVFIGEKFYWYDDRWGFVKEVEDRIVELAKEGNFQTWDS